jgi:hypothetical protein
MHSTIGCDPSSSTCSSVELRIAEFWNGRTELPGENLDKERPVAIHDSRIEYCCNRFVALIFLAYKSANLKIFISTLSFMYPIYYIFFYLYVLLIYTKIFCV